MNKQLSLEAKIKEKLSIRRQNNSLRSLQLQQDKIDFFSNDYLGLSKHIAIGKANSSGATGSRLISGNSTLFESLESKLATWHKAEAALIFNSGYDANLGLFSCIVGKGDTVIYDQFIHASIRDGLRLSACRSFSFKHNDLISLEEKLQQASGHIIVAIESVYSMDGDMAPLEAMIKLCEKYEANIIVDEAHATAIVGKGTQGYVELLGLETKVFARVHTFSKAIGTHGAVVLGSKTLKSYLCNFARSFIFTTALSEHCLLSIEQAYKHIRKSDNEKKKLNENISLFKSLLSDKLNSKLIPSKTPIQCILVPGNKEVKAIEKELQNKGFAIKAILHPTVEVGKERIRICLHSYNSEQEIRDCVKSLEELIQ